MVTDRIRAVKTVGTASVTVLSFGALCVAEEREMRNPLARRLDRVEGVCALAAVSPEKIRWGLRLWHETRRLPDEPRLRAEIEKINAFLRAMEIATCGEDSPEGSLA